MDIKDRAELAKRRILGERVDLMHNGHVYWTGDGALVVDDHFRLSFRRKALIHWRQRNWTTSVWNVGIQTLSGKLTVYMWDHVDQMRRNPIRFMPHEFPGEDLVAVNTLVINGNTLATDLATGQAVIPPGMEAPVIGQLPDGGRGYIRDSYDLETATTIERETEVHENPSGTVSIRCERDGDDLLVDFHGTVLRIEMVGELVPGRKGRPFTFAADAPEAHDFTPRVPDLVGAVRGSGEFAAHRRERAGIAEAFILGGEAKIVEGREAARRTRAALPSLKERAPARRPSPPTVQ